MPKGQSKTRGEQFSGSSLAKLPDISGGRYVIDILSSIGFALHGESLSNQEVLAWSTLTGIKLDCWTASLIPKLSCDYMIERNNSKDENTPPPYVPEIDTSDEQRALVMAKFKRLAKRGKK